MIYIKTTIENATRAARKGYIDDYDDIDEIITKLADIPLAQFYSDKTHILLTILHDFMEDNEMDCERNHEVTYGEALGMIDSLPSCGAYSEAGEQWRLDMRLTMLAHIRTLLLSARLNNSTLHLFAAISVSGYFNYLAIKMGRQGKGIKKLYRGFRKNIKQHIDFDMTKETTIKELLEKLDLFQRKCWVPNQSITEFEESIRISYGDLYCFFIRYLKDVFPEYFDFGKLKEKYPMKTKLTEEK